MSPNGGGAVSRPLRRGVALALGGLVVLSLGVLGAGLVGSVLAGQLSDAPFYVLFILLPASLGSVGVVLALKRPDNTVGWLLLVSGCLAGIAFASGEYVGYAGLAGTSGNLDRPFVLAAAWVSNVWFVPSIGMLVVYLPLLYPDGRLIGPRWRIVAVIGVFGVIAGALGPATAPELLVGNAAVANPLAPSEPLAGFIQLATTVSNVIAPVIFLVAVASLLIRFRRSHDAERQQIKWFLFVAAIAAGAFAVSMVNVSPASDVAWLIGLLSLGLLPIAIGVAILRYRLYDIDRIVSRTLSYAIVTGLLAATYLGAFAILETLFAPFTSTAGGPIAVAASTLVVFALFSPARRRISALVDRRFNRSRYDAEQTVGRLVERLRDETDLDQLGVEVEAAVRTALAPAVVAIWTRGE
jgi:MFS family permease